MIATYWRSLSARERTLLGVGLLAVIASIVYVGVLEPRYQRLKSLRNQVPAQAADLQWMKAQLHQHRDLLSGQGTESPASAQPILTTIEQSATRAGLRENIVRMQPAERGSVRVWFDDVPFDPWLQWVDALRRQNVTVTAVNIDRADPGRVNIRVTLRS